MESITNFTWSRGFEVRVWRHEKPGFNRAQKDIQSKLEKFKPKSKTFYSVVEELANYLVKISRVNAVEVRSNKQNGVVIYKNWP
jgi:hypothetical protein